MNGTIALPAPRRPLTREEADALHRQLDQMLARTPGARDIVARARQDIERHAAQTSGWDFVMVGPTENRLILERIATDAARPRTSIRLWGAILCNLDRDTNEVKMTRADMMAAAGVRHSSMITDALSEFVQWNALIRERDGARHRYWINAAIATRMDRERRAEARASHGAPCDPETTGDREPISLAERKALRSTLRAALGAPEEPGA